MSNPIRIDLHCHSEASNRAAEVALRAISCPECYSRPIDVYSQAMRRGMSFVTLTDHDTIAGATQLAQLQPNQTLIGEEVTCWFPEDDCKLHLLVWGIDPSHHDELQRRAKSIYDVSDYIESNQIAHAVAHPIYRQNDRLERWHLERLLLLFKGFECLNGAHSPRHREAFEPVLDELTAARIDLLSRRHGILPRWNEPWKKSRTAGSDDHGLLNVGRTWTQFPDDTTTTEKILACLRTAQCSPGGEAGSSAKLAHTFYSVAVRYYDRHILEGRTPNFTAQLLQMLVGARPEPSRAQKLKLVTKHAAKKLWRRARAPFASKKEREGTALLKRLFLASARRHANDHPHLYDTLRAGLPPLGEQEAMFDFVSSINRDITTGIAAAINKSIDDASFTDLFDSIAAILAQQFILLPYYFAVFHQNKERHLLAEITGRKGASIAPMKIGLFTDTFDEVNGVARFVRNIGACAESAGHSLIVHTCYDEGSQQLAWRKNFKPLLSRTFPYYSELRLSLPPLLEILEWADRQQFDAIHVSTPGPMGLAGWIVSKMLRVPLVMTHHTDFPAYARHLTGDHRIADGAATYLKWFYDQAAGIFSRSNAYHSDLVDVGVVPEKLSTIPPGIDTHRFHPRHRDESIWKKLNITQRHKLLYVGRVSKEKNLPFLVEIFQQLCSARSDTALIIAGDGPYRAEMQRQLGNLPAHFIGYQNDAELVPLYATSDIFVFPSRTDTLGQVVMEAAASGLPAIVTSDGGPRELIDDAETGYILSAQPQRWVSAISSILNDDPLRARLSRTAHERAVRFDIGKSFESFWQRHRDLAFRGDAAANSEPLAEVRT